MSNKVLLTGANGFTGYYVRQALLASGCKVINLVGANPQDDEIIVDLNDKAALCEIVKQHQPDFAIHLAALAFVAHEDQEAFYKVNVFGTLNLLQALAACDSTLKKVIIASSANIYGVPNVSRVSETEPPMPVNHYAMSKLAMECMARNWQNRLPIIFTRPFNYTGVGQNESFLIPKIVSHFRHQRPVIELGNLEVEREFNDVRMVAQAYVQLMEKATPGITVNLCSGIGHRLLSIINICKQLTGHNIEVKVNPAFIRPNELSVLVGDPTLLHQQINKLPTYELCETLEWMLQY